MNRRSFLGLLGAGTAGLALGPIPVPAAPLRALPPPIPVGLRFKGLPIVWDPDCPPGLVYMLSSNRSCYYVGPQAAPGEGRRQCLTGAGSDAFRPLSVRNGP